MSNKDERGVLLWDQKNPYKSGRSAGVSYVPQSACGFSEDNSRQGLKNEIDNRSHERFAQNKNATMRSYHKTNFGKAERAYDSGFLAGLRWHLKNWGK